MAQEQHHQVVPDGSVRPTPAFAALYDAHLPQVTRYLRRRLGEPAAEDAAAEVFVRALHGFAAYVPQGPSALPWLYGIAANVIREQRRAERRRLRTVERLLSIRPPESPEAPADRNPLDPRLARALRRLSAPDRETLLLVAWGELSYDETAVALDVPIGTVRSRIARARKHLDSTLGHVHPLGDARALTGDTHV